MERFVIELFLRGFILSLLAALALLLFRRAAAACRHLLCVLALFGFLGLPCAQRFLPALRLLPPPNTAAGHRAQVSVPNADYVPDQPPPTETHSTREPHQEPVSNAKTSTASTAEHRIASYSVDAQGPVADGKRYWSESAVLLSIWAVIASTLLIRLLVALLRLRGLKAGSRDQVLGGVPIHISDRISTPLTWGVRRSVILVPASLATGDRAICNSALRHEQAHIARWDWTWNIFAELVCALCWFQPGAWWLRSRMRLESDRACDDLVLLSGITGPDYAAHLMAIVRSACRAEVAPAMAQGRGMEERVRHILDSTKPRRVKLAWLALAASFAIVLLILSALRLSARPARDATAAGREITDMRYRDSTISSRPSIRLLAEPDFSAPRMSEPPQPALSMSLLDRLRGSEGDSGNSLKRPMHNLPKYRAPEEKLSHALPPPIRGVLWGMAVDGLQSGLWLIQSGSQDAHKIAMNSLVPYRVLVRNTTRKSIDFMVQLVPYEGFDAPYLIPNESIGEALSGREVPEEFRAKCAPHNVAGVDAAYALTLASGESVQLGPVPGPYGLFIGEGDQAGYPSIAKPKDGLNWVVQPVTIRLFTPKESANARANGMSDKLTIISSDGTASARSVALLPARNGGKKLYARAQVDVKASDETVAVSGAKVVWGKADKGMQCGIRLLNPKRTFHLGDTLEAEILWRNTSSSPIPTALPRKLDLYPSIHDAAGHWLQIDFGARFELYPISHSFEPGEERSLGVTAITLVGKQTPSPNSNKEPGHITLAPGVYKLSGSGGVSAHGAGNPISGEIEFRVIGE